MKGYSLLEVLLVLTIIGVLICFSLPSQVFFLKKTQEEILLSKLMRAIQFTRSEAILLGLAVILCKSSDQKSCGGKWEDGYIVIGNEKILFSFRNDESMGVLHWRAFPINHDFLKFYPTGFSHSENGTFWYCSSMENYPVWAIVINQTGRVRKVYPNEEHKIIDDKGNILAC